MTLKRVLIALFIMLPCMIIITIPVAVIAYLCHWVAVSWVFGWSLAEKHIDKITEINKPVTGADLLAELRNKKQ